MHSSSSPFVLHALPISSSLNEAIYSCELLNTARFTGKRFQWQKVLKEEPGTARVRFICGLFQGAVSISEHTLGLSNSVISTRIAEDLEGSGRRVIFRKDVGKSQNL
jgi:hypothetical protein